LKKKGRTYLYIYAFNTQKKKCATKKDKRKTQMSDAACRASQNAMKLISFISSPSSKSHSQFINTLQPASSVYQSPSEAIDASMMMFTNVTATNKKNSSLQEQQQYYHYYNDHRQEQSPRKSASRQNRHMSTTTITTKTKTSNQIDDDDGDETTTQEILSSLHEENEKI
jgi:hypothetical protein